MTPPTLAEIQHYKLEINDEFIDPEYFFNKYEENGWVHWTTKGEKPMKSWKGTYRTWARKAEKNPQPSRVHSRQSLDEYVTSLL